MDVIYTLVIPVRAISVRPSFDKVLTSDLKLSAWNYAPEYSSVVVPNIGADIVGNIDLESSPSSG